MFDGECNLILSELKHGYFNCSDQIEKSTINLITKISIPFEIVLMIVFDKLVFIIEDAEFIIDFMFRYLILINIAVTRSNN